MIKIDWNDLAQQVKCFDKDGNEGCSSYQAQEALEKILGEKTLKEAVDYILTLEPGFFLAELTLAEIQSPSAAAYCYEIYKTDKDLWRRQIAVSLLKRFYRPEVCQWIEEFIDDSDESIQCAGAQILLNLYDRLPDRLDQKRILDKALNHKNLQVREIAERCLL